MATILLTAPYMVPQLENFLHVFERFKLELIVPQVQERLEEDQILAYAGQFDGAICGDDRYTARVLEACSPRLKVISKWGTGIDSIDAEAAARLGIQVCRTPNAFTLPVADTVLGYMLVLCPPSALDGSSHEIRPLGEDPGPLAERMHPGGGRCGHIAARRCCAGRGLSAWSCWATTSSRSRQT